MAPTFTLSPLAFLGPLGGPEIIMIFIVLFLLAIPICLIYFLVRYFTSKGPSYSAPPPLSSPQASTQGRLQELDHLKSQNLISETEYQEKRKQILGGE